MGQDGGIRLEGERDEAGEPVGFILQFPELAEMIDAVLESFDMTVEHRAGAAASHVVPNAVDIEPFLGALLAPAEFVAHPGIENLGAAAGERSQAGVAQNFKRLRDGELEDALREMANFDRRECFDGDVRIESAQTVQQLQVPLLVQGG